MLIHADTAGTWVWHCHILNQQSPPTACSPWSPHWACSEALRTEPLPVVEQPAPRRLVTPMTTALWQRRRPCADRDESPTALGPGTLVHATNYAHDGVMTSATTTNPSDAPSPPRRRAGRPPSATNELSWIAVLDQEDCWNRLNEEPLGRIAFMTHGHPQVLPINYAADGHTVVFRTSSLFDWLSAPLPVALEIDQYDSESATGWSVICPRSAHPDRGRRRNRRVRASRPHGLGSGGTKCLVQAHSDEGLWPADRSAQAGQRRLVGPSASTLSPCSGLSR